MAVSLKVTISDDNAPRVLAALKAIHDQDEGETNKQFVRRLLRGWFHEQVVAHETNQLSVDVPLDIVDVTEEP